jgi:hypothetical protein
VEEFTQDDLARGTGITAGGTTSDLVAVMMGEGRIEFVGKWGRQKLYRFVAPAKAGPGEVEEPEEAPKPKAKKKKKAKAKAKKPAKSRAEAKKRGGPIKVQPLKPGTPSYSLGMEILTFLREHGPTTGTEIAKAIEISQPYCSLVVRALEAGGQVELTNGPQGTRPVKVLDEPTGERRIHVDSGGIEVRT